VEEETSRCDRCGEKMRYDQFAVVFLLAFLSTNAQAHDRWKNGTPIPSWIKSQCCGSADAHDLGPDGDQVHHLTAEECWPGSTQGCWRIDGVPHLIPDSDALPSEDGDFWAFYNEADKSRIYCFFAPMEF